MFNQSRSRIIRLIFLIAFVLIAIQLFYLQVISGKYRKLADENAIQKTIIYPSRGIIFDRKRGPSSIIHWPMTWWLYHRRLKFWYNILLSLMVLIQPNFVTARQPPSSETIFRPSVFEASLSQQNLPRIQKHVAIHQWFFSLQERPIRKYTYDAAAHILGYLGEVDSNFLKRHKDEGYLQGDYAGMTGLERTYEKVLMGRGGSSSWSRIILTGIQGPYENGAFDTAAVTGDNLYWALMWNYRKKERS